MDTSLSLWFEYILRFAHLVAGISWIGSSFYFIWLDSSFEKPVRERKNVDGEVFMVHGGFYYQVEKKRIAPGELPKTLHWFKWEATLTWITGAFLFVTLYYLNGASLLIDVSILPLTQPEAIFFSLGIAGGVWLLYDLVWHPRIRLSNWIRNISSLGLFAGLIYLNTQLFSGRGAVILTGVAFGTCMVLNVWVRILPGQAKMLASARAGDEPDYSLGLKSKVRSVHNTYFIFPVLLIMLSNHYPAFYNHELNWLLIMLLSVAGASVRHAMVVKENKDRWVLLPAVVSLFFLVFLMVPSPATSGALNVGIVTDERVRTIFDRRCVSCHATQNTDDVFRVAQKGLILETNEQVLRNKDKILFQVVQNKIMPLGNKTQMTDEEREVIRQWLTQAE